jgi:hypothetical protein
MPRARIPSDLLSEAEFAAQVAQLARLGGWKRYHTFRSERSPSGFPDEVLVKGPRIIFAELKRQGGRPTQKQDEWLEALRIVAAAVVEARLIALDHGLDPAEAPRLEVYLWQPADLEAIAELLTGRVSRALR